MQVVFCPPIALLYSSPLTRPASIRTLCEAICFGASWGPQFLFGCCYLKFRTERFSEEECRSALTSQSPGRGDVAQKLKSFQAAADFFPSDRALLLRSGS